MPDNVYVWISLIVLTSAVVGLAVFRGSGLTLTKDNGKYKIKVKEKQAADTRVNQITVAREIEIKEAELRDITGRKGASRSGIDRPEHIEVAGRAKIERTKLGDITGVKQEGPAQADESNNA